MHCSEGSDAEAQKHSLAAREPSADDSGISVATRLEQENELCPAENPSNFPHNRDYDRPLSTENTHERIPPDCSQLESHFELPGDIPPIVIGEETAIREVEQQSAEALQGEKTTFAASNEQSQMHFNATTSDGEHDLGDPLVHQFAVQHDHEAADICITNNGGNCPVETSNAVTNAYDKAIEKKLQLWVDTKGEPQSDEEPINMFERSYPSHEFEYWAVEVSSQHYPTYAAPQHPLSTGYSSYC